MKGNAFVFIWLRALKGAVLCNLTCLVSFLLADLQFPIDLSNVAKDHPFLENDPLQSLYRRLVALNNCATMRLDNAHHSKHQAQVSRMSKGIYIKCVLCCGCDNIYFSTRVHIPRCC